MSYPTWKSIARGGCIVSEEQVDGTPDFILERVDNKWYLKHRVSAMWQGPYATSLEAKEAAI